MNGEPAGATPAQRQSIRSAQALFDFVMDKDNVVYELDAGDQVVCVHCTAQGCHDLYGKGEAFLAGPGHTPLDGNANYVCREHLDRDAKIWGG